MFGKQLKKALFGLGALIATAAVFIPQLATAQPPLPGVDDGMIVVPIAGGVILLLAGAVYGIKKYNSK